jgi:hypothetical protein
MVKELKIWKNSEGQRLPEIVLQKLAMEDSEFDTEFQLVEEWYPLFKVIGKNPRVEIIRYWEQIYPDRAKKNRNFLKLQKKLSWWDEHTNMKLFNESKHKIVTLEVKV